MGDWILRAGGWLEVGGRRIDCVIGRGGRRLDKREGDGATPVGRWPLRRALYRPDRLAPISSALPVAPILPDDLWCDDPASPLYNRPTRRPFAASAEDLWRADGLYDVVVVVGHNDAPPVPDLGSAIFVHVAAPDGRPTAGCVALDRAILVDLVAAAMPGAALVVEPLGA